MRRVCPPLLPSLQKRLPYRITLMSFADPLTSYLYRRSS